MANAQTDSIKGIGEIHPNFDNDFKYGIYIPKDMSDCLDELDDLLPDYVKDSMKTLDLRASTLKYGRLMQWISKKWALWDTSRIVKYFSQYGFKKAPTIARGIFESFWNYSNDKEITIEAKPKAYVINKNLFLVKTDTIISFPKKRPNPKGTLMKTTSLPQFIFMGRKFTLIDSLYMPIVDLILNSGFQASDSLWYIWWTKISKFGYGFGEPPEWVDEDFLRKYSKVNSYNADLILILEDKNKEKIKQIIRNNKFDDEFINYIRTKHHLAFHLIRMRKVIHFD